MEVYNFTTTELTAFANKVKDMLSPLVDNKLDEVLVTVGKPSMFGRFMKYVGGTNADDPPNELRITLSTTIKKSKQGE